MQNKALNLDIKLDNELNWLDFIKSLSDATSLGGLEWWMKDSVLTTQLDNNLIIELTKVSYGYQLSFAEFNYQADCRKTDSSELYHHLAKLYKAAKLTVSEMKSQFIDTIDWFENLLIQVDD